ncbi:hypothetical protein EMIT0P44_130112 [Pseudomonas sp. IT-P44]
MSSRTSFRTRLLGVVALPSRAPTGFLPFPLIVPTGPALCAGIKPAAPARLPDAETREFL